MTLRKFLQNASKIKDELQDKEIVIRAENGLLFTPEIKFILKEGEFSLDDKGVDKVIIQY